MYTQGGYTRVYQGGYTPLYTPGYTMVGIHPAHPTTLGIPTHHTTLVYTHPTHPVVHPSAREEALGSSWEKGKGSGPLRS